MPAVRPVLYGIVLATSTWAYIDAKKIGLERYDTPIRSPGVILTLGILFWIIGVPHYLAARHKIKRGQLRLLNGTGEGMPPAAAPHLTPAASPFGAPASAMPPPIDQWFYHMNGQQLGPVTKDQLFEMARKGQITRDTMVWTQGMQAWSRAEQVLTSAA
jgi:hypothetical protein